MSHYSIQMHAKKIVCLQQGSEIVKRVMPGMSSTAGRGATVNDAADATHAMQM